MRGGTELDLFFTDPPYNVAVVGGSHAIPPQERIEAGEKTIQNDDMSDEDFREFLNRAFSNAKQVLKDGGAFYIFHASRFQRTFENALEENELQVKQQLVWVKNSLVMGRQDYQWMHELCFYGWKSGASHYFIDNRKLTTIIEDKLDFEKMKKEDMKKILEEIYSEKLPTTIIRENRPLMSQISDFLSLRGSGRSARFLTYWISTQLTHLVGISWSMVRMLFKTCITA